MAHDATPAESRHPQLRCIHLDPANLSATASQWTATSMMVPRTTTTTALGRQLSAVISLHHNWAAMRRGLVWRHWVTGQVLSSAFDPARRKTSWIGEVRRPDRRPRRRL